MSEQKILPVVTVKIHDLKPHPSNPNTHPDWQIEQLVASIQDNGWTKPVVITEKMVILAGHGAVEAAKADFLALEPLVSMGDWRTRLGSDHWTVSTADGSLSAHFEHTIAITDAEAEVLTVA